MRRIKLGVIGTGDVLVKYYLPTLRAEGDALEIVAVCSADPARAAAAAAALGAPEQYGEYRRMLERTEAELILNLTPAQLHYEVNLAALRAGKHLYSEKPLARTVAEVDDLIAAADAAGVRVDTAPSVLTDPLFDTLRRALAPEDVGAVAFAHANAFQGGPLSAAYDQRRAKLIAEGGVDVLARPEDKPDQAWFYQKGGGPLYDYGIYQVTMLTGRTFATDEDDNTVVLLDFGDATLASLSASWHGTASEAPQVEFVCQRGTVSLPMANPGDRRVVRVHADGRWRDLPVEGAAWTVASGLPAFARSLRDGPPSPAGAALAGVRHVIDVLEKAGLAARTGHTQAVGGATAHADTERGGGPDRSPRPG